MYASVAAAALFIKAVARPDSILLHNLRRHSHDQALLPSTAQDVDGVRVTESKLKDNSQKVTTQQQDERINN